MERCYRFAGVEVLIRGDEFVLYQEERTLAPFRVDAVSDPHVFHVEMVSSLPEPRGKLIASEPGFLVYENGQGTERYIGMVGDGWIGAYLLCRSDGKAHSILCCRSHFSGRIGVKSVLTALGAEHLIAQSGGFVFHCSFIEVDGRAVVFTAPSETGKSTQAELWKQHRGSNIINGDRAAIRVTADGILAEGIPFSGSSRDCQNCSLPLGAVVYLAQAPVTTIRRLRGYEAFLKIWEGVSVNTWDRADMAIVSAAVQQLAQTIPIFYMPCTPDEAAVIALEYALKEVWK